MHTHGVTGDPVPSTPSWQQSVSSVAWDEHLEGLRLINLGRREMSTANEPLGHLSKLWHIRMRRGKQAT